MMIGRKKEIEILTRICQSKESKLAVVTGRRRIGKTYLIDYMFKEHRKDCMLFDYAGDYEGNFDIQLTNFFNKLHSWFKVRPEQKIDNWADAFYFLWETINNEIEKKKHSGKVVIFIDEVPWVDKNDKDGFISALGYFWNEYANKQKNFILILCGSNSAWVSNKIIKDKGGPLFGRVDKVIHLMPFTLQETKEYLVKEKGYDVDDMSIIDAYMVFGGVAKYLSYLESERLITQNIDDILFSLSGRLYDEYELLFQTLFHDKSGYHKQIVDAIYKLKNSKTRSPIKQEIIKKLGTTQTDPKVGIALNDLEQCGFISSLSKFKNKKKGDRYIISDNYCLFYKKWLENFNKNDLAKLDGYWSSILDKGAHKSWAGLAFEVVAMNNIEYFIQARGMPLNTLKSLSYWEYIAKDDNERGAQIDLLIEYNNNVFEIVECKYTDNTFSIGKDYINDLLNKREMFRKYGVSNRYTIIMSMYTTFGTIENSYYERANIRGNVKLEDILFS